MYVCMCVYIYIYVCVYVCMCVITAVCVSMTIFNGFTQKKARTRRYPAETITGPDYADDLALLANTPPQAECLLHSLEQVVRDLYVNPYEIELKSPVFPTVYS